jgi:starch synthase
LDRPLKILIVAAEAVPFAKVGGMADVVGALPIALKRLGHDVRVAIPRYGRISQKEFGLSVAVERVEVPLDNRKEPATIYLGHMKDEVPVYLVHNDRYFGREGIYGYPDDDERFVFFCRAVLEMLKPLEWAPEVIHLNDWHTAIIANWLKTILAKDPFYSPIATVYTIHNLAYQGIFGYRVLEIAGLAEYGFIYHKDIKDLDNVVDLMARGILFADIITTVSERYAEEILQPEYGERLDPLLRDRRDRLFGVLNGIDVELYNPATDPNIAARFDASTIDERVKNKEALQKELHMERAPTKPLIAMISRLVDQKGLDILAEAIHPIMRYLPTQFVLLGTGDQHYQELFRALAAQYPGRTGVALTFNAALAQRIYAGSDMFLMPSRFEPCGLGQMIAMRYGSVPIVRRTGGLADTVQDYDPASEEGTGFVFDDYNPWALFTAVVRAAENYKVPSRWRKLMLNCMSKDFSWDRSAKRYVELYQLAIAYNLKEKGLAAAT